MTVQKTTLRRRLRDALLQSISVLPLSWKLWLHQNHPRYLLGVLFRLEKEPVTVSPAGPAGARFMMKLSWQGHTAYALGTYEPETVQLLAKFVKEGDRKSTRLNSSHRCISYAVFCLKKKKQHKT